MLHAFDQAPVFTAANSREVAPTLMLYAFDLRYLPPPILVKQMSIILDSHFQVKYGKTAVSISPIEDSLVCVSYACLVSWMTNMASVTILISLIWYELMDSLSITQLW